MIGGENKGVLVQQQTLKKEASVDGIGLHTGRPVSLKLLPAPPDTGIVFRRIDLANSIDIKANLKNVVDTRLCTTIASDGVRVATVEHIMAAFAGLGIDNAIVTLTDAEVPIMDGSAAVFVNLIESAGVSVQHLPKKYIRIKNEIEVTDGDKWARLKPFDGFKLSFSINFDHPTMQMYADHATIDLSQNSFTQDLSRARTFGFLQDIEALREAGLARGGSLENAIVMDDHRVINDGGLRYGDEFVKHKILDAIGDLYLIGSPLMGEFSAYKSGHKLNNQILQALETQPSCWESVSFSTEKRQESVDFMRPVFS